MKKGVDLERKQNNLRREVLGLRRPCKTSAKGSHGCERGTESCPKRHVYNATLRPKDSGN